MIFLRIKFMDKYLRGKEVIEQEAKALLDLANNLSPVFSQVVDKILSLSGRVIFAGIGKSGYIARKIAASFASTGTPSIYLHPAEASHGDLGMITKDDLMFLFSNSGETKELGDIINYCKRFSIEIVAITMNPKSTLAKYSDSLLQIPKWQEASSIGAPTTSSTMMLALGDALVVATHEQRGICHNVFGTFHPGGKLGARLKTVDQLMHTGKRLPIVAPKTIMSEVLIEMTRKSLGCCVVVENGYIIGIITDGDLRRHMHQNIFNRPARDIMSLKQKVISPKTLAFEALKEMNEKSITNLLIAEDSKLIGIIHIHDLLRAGLM